MQFPAFKTNGCLCLNLYPIFPQMTGSKLYSTASPYLPGMTLSVDAFYKCVMSGGTWVSGVMGGFIRCHLVAFW
jgi:hypothetical protein